MNPYDDMRAALVSIMKVLLWGSLIGVLVIGAFMMRAVLATETHQGEPVYVGVIVLIVVAVIVDKLVKLHTKER